MLSISLSLSLLSISRLKPFPFISEEIAEDDDKEKLRLLFRKQVNNILLIFY